jgi:hypothetical protein
MFCAHLSGAVNLAQPHDKPCSKIHVSVFGITLGDSHRDNFLEESGGTLHAAVFNLKPHPIPFLIIAL